MPEGRREDETLPDFLRRSPLPCVVKPVCGEKLGLTAADRYIIARTEAEAEAACARFSQLAGEPPVVQAYLPGGALGCSVLAQDGRVLAAICHRRLREYPVSGGPSSCCASVDAPVLQEYAARMVGHTGYTGLAMFEFKEDGAGTPRLLEINLDNPAPLPETPVPQRKKMIFAASDLMAAAGYLRRGKPGKALGAFADLVNPTVRDGLFEWGDILPGLAYFRALLAKERHK